VRKTNRVGHYRKFHMSLVMIILRTLVSHGIRGSYYKITSKKNQLARYSSPAIACEVGCIIIGTYQLSRRLHKSFFLFNVFSKVDPCSLNTTLNLFELASAELENLPDSHFIVDRSLLYSQDSSLLVPTTLIFKGGHVNMKEPEGLEVMKAYGDTQIIFNWAGWYIFCTKLDGHHYDIARAFVESFNGKWAQVGKLAMQVTKESIAATCNLPTDGERWFNNKLITGGEVN
jgi:hypothetical protein